MKKLLVNGQAVNAVLVTTIKDNKLSVNISVEPFSESRIESRITTKDVLIYLKNEKNLIPSECLFSSVISNLRDDSLFGTWEFSMPIKIQDKFQASDEVKDESQMTMTVVKTRKNKTKDKFVLDYEDMHVGLIKDD